MKVTKYDLSLADAVVTIALEATVPIESLVHLADTLREAQVALERESGAVVSITYDRLLVRDDRS
jgi:hypothetical protein